MGSISVRRLDDAILEGLRLRAERHGVSMEEEVRRILQDVVNPPERISEIARRYFGPEHGIRLEPPERETHDPIDFSK
ncbi:MAG: hypothetical protein GC201_13010 [Alphaproteobacteria bacterium]|nr:hypothetical protein [Alphaproteobacteria bacterium]